MLTFWKVRCHQKALLLKYSLMCPAFERCFSVLWGRYVRASASLGLTPGKLQTHIHRPMVKSEEWGTKWQFQGFLSTLQMRSHGFCGLFPREGFLPDPILPKEGTSTSASYSLSKCFFFCSTESHS